MKVVKEVVVAAAITLALVASLKAAAPAVPLPDPALDDQLAATPATVSLVIAGGCFWGIEELYQHVRGVTDVVSGYSGGSAKSANYSLVSMGSSGHAESVKITYDPSKITYGQLLTIFFAVAHDPTQKGGQGPDVGPQYRSVIFAADERQRAIAAAYIAQLTAARAFKRSITTQVVPLTAFYDAEAYHQDYAVHHPTQPYIVINDLPKVEALKKQFPQIYVR
jgi:peptide-methionine (S)-S-oxide reductase